VTGTGPSVQDAGVFIGLISHYFVVTGGTEPQLLPPTLEWQSPARLASTGYIPVSGSLNGWIAVSLPDRMLENLLAAVGEDRRDEAALLDLTGEMVNVITSNARAHFGARLHVEPPVATREPTAPSSLPEPAVSFKLPFRWKGDDAFLLVALQDPPPTSS
jgi:hypothetical protein